MGKRIDGKEIALEIKEEIKEFVNKRKENNLNVPKVASILVGNDGGSLFYLNNQEKVATSLGMEFEKVHLNEEVTEEELINKIDKLKKEIDELLETKCEMIALDATLRDRPNGEKLEDLVAYIHENGILAMADCSTFEECVNAEKIGFDCVSTTLCGYTPYSVLVDGPNIPLLKKLVAELHTPILAEGKINTPEDLAAVYEAGVHSAVVGGAITRPKQITERFVKVLK